jgi:LCCL domain
MVDARRPLAVVLAAAAALGATGASASPRTVEPTPTGSDWTANAQTLRTATGSRFLYVCPANGRLDQVWGTRVYTDDSSVCTAAVHAGLITVAEGGLVTIEHLPGQSSYTGSVANGVTSVSWGAWGGSFQLIGADKGGGTTGVLMGGGSWIAQAASFRGKNGQKYLFICPGGGRIGTIYGTNTYTDDSSVCTAAVQVGLITPANGGRVVAEIAAGLKSYVSATANGVTSRPYVSWLGSFRFPTAATIPTAPSPGGGGGGGPPSTTTTTTTSSTAPIPPPTATPTGTVTVNGRPFTGGPIQYNTTVDVTHGTLKIVSTTGTLTVNGAGGITAAFTLLRGLDGKTPVVVLRLAKGDFSPCKRKKASASLQDAHVVRQLWGNGQGHFQTKGLYAAATVRGTNWLTADRCDGTQVQVRRGVVAVLDIPHRKTVTVRAGKNYLAKP